MSLLSRRCDFCINCLSDWHALLVVDDLCFWLVILMSFTMIFQLIGMHGLDVTCLPDLLIFVLSLKLKINYFVHFLKNLSWEEKCLWNTLRSWSFVLKDACSEIMIWHASSSLSHLCGAIFNKSPGIRFWVHLQNLWELFISGVCRYLILKNVQASVYFSKS